MKVAILILAALYFPLVIGGTVAAMVYAKQGALSRHQGIREFAAVGGVIVVLTLAGSVLLVLRAI